MSLQVAKPVLPGAPAGNVSQTGVPALPVGGQPTNTVVPSPGVVAPNQNPPGPLNPNTGTSAAAIAPDESTSFVPIQTPQQQRKQAYSEASASFIASLFKGDRK